MTGHLFNATSNFVHHVVAINRNSSYNPETLNWDENRSSFITCDPEISRLTLKNNNAPLLCYYKKALCINSQASVKSNYRPETPNSDQNRQFLIRMILKFDG